jgi:hypothetical protein
MTYVKGTRYNFYAGHTYMDPLLINVPGDVFLPFEYPDWLPAGECEVIQNYAMNRVPFPDQWLSIIWEKLSINGVLKLAPVPASLLPIFEKYGFEVMGYSEEEGLVEARLAVEVVHE